MRFLIMGAGGFAKEVADLCRILGHEPIAFFHEATSHSTTGHVGITLPCVSALDAVAYDAVVVAVGSPSVRERFFHMAGPDRCPTLVHPTASISPEARLGRGVLVMQYAVVNADAQVEDAAILNVGCCVAHDCFVGAYCHIAPSTQMGGGSSIGQRSETGLSSVILPGVSVGARTRVGAAAVCIRDVGDDLTVVGIPARPVGSH